VATYLDVASAAPWHPAALAAHAHVAEAFPGDPSRLHAPGREASDLLERARAAVAAALGGRPEGVVFTGSATEAIHLAVQGTAAANRTRPRRLLSSAVEHSAVLAAGDAAEQRLGHEHVRVPVDGEGRVRLDALEAALADGGAALVSVQAANHEVGTLQPLPEVAALCRAAGALLHVDACQVVGRLPVDLAAMGADYLSLSAAKVGAGRGVGALLTSPAARMAPLLTGDERERRRRAGLQDLPGTAALAEVLAALDPADPAGEAASRARACDAVRRHLRAALADRVPDLALHGPGEGALPHLVACSALYVDGQALVAALDAAGYAVHSGSSCASTSGEPSHVLVAMGALTHGHVRASFDESFTAEAADDFVEAVAAAVADLRARAGM
jgi:cysteine desulfurase